MNTKKKITGWERGYYVDPILFEDGTYKDYDDYERSMGKMVAQLVDIYKTAAGRKRLKRAGLTDFVKKAINSKNSLNQGRINFLPFFIFATCYY